MASKGLVLPFCTLRSGRTPGACFWPWDAGTPCRRTGTGSTRTWPRRKISDRNLRRPSLWDRDRTNPSSRCRSRRPPKRTSGEISGLGEKWCSAFSGSFRPRDFRGGFHSEKRKGSLNLLVPSHLKSLRFNVTIFFAKENYENLDLNSNFNML